MSAIKNVLSIGGSDPSGGAGIQADLKTFAANGVYGMAIISALTAQNTRGVKAIHCPDAGFVEAQIDCLFEDIQPAAVKIGMLANAAIIRRVAARLRHYRAPNIVVDPVMLASSGQRLLDPCAVEVLVHELLPLARLYTPNLHEGASLLGTRPPNSRQEMLTMAKQLQRLSHSPVLLKGGHLPGRDSPDVLIDGDGSSHWFIARRIAGEAKHGTGCTLSAAIAANLARDNTDLSRAVKNAKIYLCEALISADQLKVGTGPGPLNHSIGFEIN
ncbi:MAG: bifunctional hydroxymethylpyrimidine kinase/phosphomethylpyrimidine kinase [Gammaproteobacteria bacterium]|nr:bifunctional hydroxymethylpyrimidine kinase/phosphomethylpyrimidine kinase [Gammaproteobacteria bacterium]MBQ0840578.1 bifunctional hydroxymethylpyrimidine kinase/phosphomethylpyrimidine kinase [Gammaproteobacteria bacterium]